MQVGWKGRNECLVSVLLCFVFEFLLSIFFFFLFPDSRRVLGIGDLSASWKLGLGNRGGFLIELRPMGFGNNRRRLGDGICFLGFP